MMKVHKVKLLGGEDGRAGDGGTPTLTLYGHAIEAYCSAQPSAGPEEVRRHVLRRLKERAYGVRAETRRCRNMFRGIAHAFLVVTHAPDGVAFEEPILVDPGFKDLFDIARHSPHYEEVFEAIPEVYVGTGRQLRDRVVLLCWEMEKSFYATGLSTPAMRRAENMLCRWGVGGELADRR